jgi:hypothetical protein
MPSLHHPEISKYFMRFLTLFNQTADTNPSKKIGIIPKTWNGLKDSEFLHPHLNPPPAGGVEGEGGCGTGSSMDLKSLLRKNWDASDTEGVLIDDRNIVGFEKAIESGAGESGNSKGFFYVAVRAGYQSLQILLFQEGNAGLSNISKLGKSPAPLYGPLSTVSKLRLVRLSARSNRLITSRTRFVRSGLGVKMSCCVQCL